jgi:hypothetical protein
MDGERGLDEIHTEQGVIIDGNGQILSSTQWYWNQQTLSGSEGSLHEHDQWSPYSRTYDVTGDSREEIIVWGLHAFVVGTNSTSLSNPPASMRGDLNYKTRDASSTINRGGLYYDFQSNPTVDAEKIGMGNNAPVNLSVWPNPFRTSAYFEMRPTESELRSIHVGIYDIAGKLVCSPVAGHQSPVWDAAAQPVGTYFVTVKAGNKTMTKRISKIK